METTVKQRLTEFLKYLEISQSKFEKRIGAGNGFVNNIVKSIGTEKLQSIKREFPELNTEWLLYGCGEMLSCPDPENPEKHGKIIPYYDAEAAAGAQYDMDMAAVSTPSQMIEIGTLLRESEAAIRVYGNSMTPNYPAGCVIGTRPNINSFIEPGKVYVVETRGGRYLKRLYYNDTKTAYECVSDNMLKYEDGERKGKPYYPTFEIPLDEVICVHVVVGVIKRNIM